VRLDRRKKRAPSRKDRVGTGNPDQSQGEEKRLSLEVKVQNNQIESAIKTLKRQLIRDGVLKELKNRRAYEKPSVKKKRKQREARRRRQKAARRQSRQG
jgi:small subunit ribosomal protein S21